MIAYPPYDGTTTVTITVASAYTSTGYIESPALPVPRTELLRPRDDRWHHFDAELATAPTAGPAARPPRALEHGQHRSTRRARSRLPSPDRRPAVKRDGE